MISQEKQILRAQMKNTLRQLSGREKASARIAHVLPTLSSWTQARVVYAFAPLPSEPNWRQVSQEEKVFAFPRVQGELMDFFVASSWVLGPLGNLEPEGSEPAPPPDLILVPGLAFSSDGHRLGRGRGYYDRWLENRGRVAAVGLCFDCQIMPRIPCEPHDAMVDCVVTESRVLWPGEGR